MPHKNKSAKPYAPRPGHVPTKGKATLVRKSRAAAARKRARG